MKGMRREKNEKYLNDMDEIHDGLIIVSIDSSSMISSVNLDMAIDW